MHKEPIASAVLMAASKVLEHYVQRLDPTLHRAQTVTNEAAATTRQVVSDANEPPRNADRRR